MLFGVVKTSRLSFVNNGICNRVWEVFLKASGKSEHFSLVVVAECVVWQCARWRSP